MDNPTVIQADNDDNSASLTLYIDGELDIFKGHFDEAPIVPGVVQLKWAIDFCGRYLKPLQADGITQIEALKFQQVIPPNTTVQLQLALQKNKLVFSITSDDNATRHSSGRIAIS